MLRFDGGRFVLETEPLPRRFQIVQGGRGGISGFGDFRPAVVREGVAAGAQGK
jgi:hypothetical protein